MAPSIRVSTNGITSGKVIPLENLLYSCKYSTGTGLTRLVCWRCNCNYQVKETHFECCISSYNISVCTILRRMYHSVQYKNWGANLGTQFGFYDMFTSHKFRPQFRAKWASPLTTNQGTYFETQAAKFQYSKFGTWASSPAESLGPYGPYEVQ